MSTISMSRADCALGRAPTGGAVPTGGPVPTGGAAPDLSPAAVRMQPWPATVLVWDLPVRLFHWLMVLCFAGAWLTAESERWRLVHLGCGYTMAGLVVFRILWGLRGPHYARFAQFVRGPAVTLRYLRTMLAGRPERHLGHNPLGALAIVLLLALTALIAGTGWVALDDTAPAWAGNVHEGLAEAMVGLVAVHLAGVLLASWQHRENLVLAMLSGRKERRGTEEGPSSTCLPVAILMLAVAGFFWGWQLLA